MERSIIPDERIYKSLQSDFVLIAQYTDDKHDSKPSQVFKRFAAEGDSVPLYVITDQDGNELGRLSWPALKPNMTKEEFSEFMRTSLAKFKAK